jgi:hypothetical protein
MLTTPTTTTTLTMLQNLPNTEETFPIELDFGDKILHFRLWKGKDRRTVHNIINTEGIDIEKIYDVLTYGCMKEKNIYITEDEKQYVLYMIKNESMSDVLIFDYVCSECSTVNTEVVNYSNILKPKLSNFEDISIEGLTFSIKPIIQNAFNRNTLTNAKNSFDKLFYELLLSIRSISVNKNTKNTETTETIKDDIEVYEDYSFEELTFFVDNLESQIFDELVEQYSKQRFELKPVIDCECENNECKHITKIVIDSIPDFIEDWVN